MSTQRRTARAGADRRFLIGLARAFGGAIFFSLPLLMTMEMWHLGYYLDRGRVALFVVATLPMLMVLDRYSGFLATSTVLEDVVDALIAFGVGCVAAVTILLPFGIIEPGMPLREIVGKVALQAVPGSFGAVLANSQFAGDREQEQEEESRRRGGYPAQLFFMLVGAVFLAFNIAPTEEVLLLAARITPVHALAILALTLGLMHAFVFASQFRGAPEHAAHESRLGLFFRFTVVGYAIAFLISAYVLWTFQRIGAHAGQPALVQVVVLSLPAGLGAAAARLIL